MVIVTFTAGKQRTPSAPAAVRPSRAAWGLAHSYSTATTATEKKNNRQDCAYSGPGRNEITFVQDKNEVFPVFLLFKVGFHMRGASAYGIPGIKNLNNNIWWVNHLKNKKKIHTEVKDFAESKLSVPPKWKLVIFETTSLIKKTFYLSETAISPQTSEVQTKIHSCSTLSSLKFPPNSARTAERFLPVLMHQEKKTLHPNGKTKVLQHTNPQCSSSIQQQLPSTIS